MVNRELMMGLGILIVILLFTYLNYKTTAFDFVEVDN